MCDGVILVLRVTSYLVGLLYINALSVHREKGYAVADQRLLFMRLEGGKR